MDLSSLVRGHEQAAAAAAGRPAGAPAAAQGAPGAPVAVPGLAFQATDAAFNDVVEISTKLPVVVLIWSPRSALSDDMRLRLATLIAEQAGRLVLATVDGDANPQLVQAFQAQSVPTVAGLVGGRPLPMFEGDQPDEQIRDIFSQLVEIAGQSGVNGVAEVADAEEAAEAEPEPLPPLHQEAFDAIESGDFPVAIAAYEKAILQNPHDTVARAGLAQVRLLDRLSHGTLEEIRAAAAAGPTDIPAQLAVADLDISGGHVDDAFGRLLDLFPGADAEGRTALRERLVEYFDVVGIDDPRVVRARARLTNLLF